MALPLHPDLPPDLACLKNIDALLQCPICFDFLDISMMTKCSHNFCSLCIRKFLSYKLQCPICNMQMTEQDLRNNRLLDELVVNFKAVRQQLSKANFDSPPISPRTPASLVKCRTPSGRGQSGGGGSVLSQFFQKKPSTPHRKEAQCDDSVADSAQQVKPQASPSHRPSGSDPHSKKTQFPVVVKEEATEVEVKGVQVAPSPSPSSDVKPVNKVECPVCSVSVSQQFINNHLDTCLTREEKKESLRSNPAKARRPMAKLVYNLLSVQELKRKLKECHLSVQGSRDQMIKRHQTFVHLYNSQCDSLNPKSAEDIAKEVEAEEKVKNQLQKTAKPAMVFSKKQTEKEIDEMHSNYRKRHSSDFSRLIAQVRGRLETSRHAKQKVTAEKQDAQVAQAAESTSSLVIKLDEETDGEQSASRTDFPSSPACSDVSISRDTERASPRKRTSSSRGEGVASLPVSGKRRRKT
ncbi:E3 ubiquitin-protein ligase RAD18 isoform X2 [Salarias fasciatus]|uniref:E3 ubiquitin-protein ligase RAD18 isoform X2 n=1 Tax=Salarias fasciatus TaxID=181472 RepID=UPI0011768E23|nr:E3 ubiquitin-protein ligase RAD18 isoform X2 [Salarias fasciatus]